MTPFDSPGPDPHAPQSDEAPIILVTGAARRVGAEIARHLHAAGARLALHYRSSAGDAGRLAASLNGLRADSAFTVGGDLGRAGVAEEVAAATLARCGCIDGLVNNASSFFPTPVGRIDHAAWDDLIGSNLMGPLFLAQALAPALRQRRGAIVNIVDIHAERPLPGYPLYSAAKAGLAGLTRALAIELAPEVRVNGVSPGPIEWPEDGQFSPEERQQIIGHTLLKRIGSATDIARTVRFLMFDAPYITGQIIAVDGGRSAHL
ncbi:pteridine reductase [Thauera linaloolentis]|uniref:Pteridine reductase n=1 Tax=Thauera linaloolentis (strain DSM 12138 / JCM 21573 / CCUG 41526 / CIP 105981 / IAM 15112 / NBRC 102519 / 47Lol) TaxID=1123367 RepID=N6XQB2_THAL4|nr:pteridine reductase [Thauera linaloolentis]ENO83856.1 pteridine reductase [Thauera linaloolentis 47Lol = DSM 12138]MCM8566800.1 pteridine reductase [Thauera linaloolentis]